MFVFVGETVTPALTPEDEEESGLCLFISSKALKPDLHQLKKMFLLIVNNNPSVIFQP